MKKTKIPILLLFFIPLLCSFAIPADFELAMGKGTTNWNFVQTNEDRAHIEFFKKLYEKNHQLTSASPHQIPKTLHIVWLGPEEFPEASIKNINRWMQMHPDWMVKFWTDMERAAPCAGMVIKRFEDFHLGSLESFYFQSENFGEKSELLRYAILFNEGGLYVDHDTAPLQSFDALQDNYSFYCGLETPLPSMLSSSVFPSTHLIASKPNHPIFQQAIEWLSCHWEKLERSYPLSDRASLVNRVKRRSFSALSEGIRKGIDQEGNRDIVFPSNCFSLLEQKAAVYSTHAHAGTWNKKENAWEQKVLNQLQVLQKQERRKQILVYALLCFNLLVFLWLGTKLMRIKWKKSVLLLALLPSALFGSDDFEQLMGKDTAHWSHIVQTIDKSEMNRYKALYDKNKALLHASSSDKKIPSVIHFIWLGPRPFPPQSVENVRTWMAMHPDWVVKFWTDRDRPPPCNDMQVCQVQDFPFLRLKHCYDSSENYGEKSDVLRFEILYQEGGVYADHDANCLHPFKQLNAGFDFYGCLETPHPAFVGRNLTSGNGVIGSRPGHPTIEKVIDLIATRWETLGKRYPGRDNYSRTQLVMERTYIALTDALATTVDREGNVDIVLPSSYFFAKSGLSSLYSKHFYANAWADAGTEKSAFEKELPKEMGKLKHKQKQIEKALWALMVLNGFMGLFCVIKRRATIRN